MPQQRKLFLWFEALGMNIPDWKGLPSNYESLFNVVVIIATNKMISDNSKINTPWQELAFFTSVEALLPPSMKSERWVSLYFDVPPNAEPLFGPCVISSNLANPNLSSCISGVSTYLNAYKAWSGWGPKGAPVGFALDQEGTGGEKMHP